MSGERLEINVTFAGGYYHASHPRLPTICALSLAVLRKRVEEKLNGPARPAGARPAAAGW